MRVAVIIHTLLHVHPEKLLCVGEVTSDRLVACRPKSRNFIHDIIYVRGVTDNSKHVGVRSRPMMRTELRREPGPRLAAAAAVAAGPGSA